MSFNELAAAFGTDGANRLLRSHDHDDDGRITISELRRGPAAEDRGTEQRPGTAGDRGDERDDDRSDAQQGGGHGGDNDPDGGDDAGSDGGDDGSDNGADDGGDDDGDGGGGNDDDD